MRTLFCTIALLLGSVTLVEHIDAQPEQAEQEDSACCPQEPVAPAKIVEPVQTQPQQEAACCPQEPVAPAKIVEPVEACCPQEPVEPDNTDVTEGPAPETAYACRICYKGTCVYVQCKDGK